MKKTKKITLLILAVMASASLMAQSVFINEIHYDNAGVDQGESVEVFGLAQSDLNGWELVLYNGETGKPYYFHSFGENDVIPDQGQVDGLASGVISVSVSLQNGDADGDGMALVDNTGAVQQFISYEGSFLAVEGPATGMESTDIGVMEDGSDPAGKSLQSKTSGWDSPTSETFGEFNQNQGGNEGGGSSDCCLRWIGNNNILDQLVRLGNVGIGQVPQAGEKLRVQGNLGISGNINGLRDDTALGIFGNSSAFDGGYIRLYGDGGNSAGQVTITSNANGAIRFFNSNNGSFEQHMKILHDGAVVIGDAADPSSGFLLAVAEGIQTQKVKVCADANNWCDYVFEENYPLNSIDEVEAFVKEHKHLPNVPSAEEVEAEGINVAEMDATLLRQIEELWLHLIELKKENESLKTLIKQQKQ